MKKSDEFKVRWIILQKQKEEITSKIVETEYSTIESKSSGPDANTRIRVGMSTLFLERLGNSLSGRREHSVVLVVRTEDHLGAIRRIPILFYIILHF